MRTGPPAWHRRDYLRMRARTDHQPLSLFLSSRSCNGGLPSSITATTSNRYRRQPESSLNDQLIDHFGRYPKGHRIAMSLRHRLNSMAFHLILLSSILLSWFPGSILSAVVTLDSMEIFRTHELFGDKPTVYFQCKGENKTFLPDVKKTHISYTFKGEESWQPLTEFANKKCKRCGFYEEDFLKTDKFDEWEFCPSDFNKPNGRYNRFNDKEFNATFLCSECEPLGSDSNDASASHNGGKGMHWALVVTISVLVSVVFILGLVAGYKYWQKRRREQEQARFLKLFEEGDDIEDELGIGPIGGVI